MGWLIHQLTWRSSQPCSHKAPVYQVRTKATFRRLQNPLRRGPRSPLRHQLARSSEIKATQPLRADVTRT